MGRHEAPPRATFQTIVADYITERAFDLVREFDGYMAQPADVASVTSLDWARWSGSAAEILRELTRDA